MIFSKKYQIISFNHKIPGTLISDERLLIYIAISHRENNLRSKLGKLKSLRREGAWGLFITHFDFLIFINNLYI